MQQDTIDWVNDFYRNYPLAQRNAKVLMFKRGAEEQEPPFGIVLTAVLLALNDKTVDENL